MNKCLPVLWAIGVLWLVLVSVGCSIPDPGLEAILRDASSRKQNAPSQNAQAKTRLPLVPSYPSHPSHSCRHCNDLDKRNADLGWKSILRESGALPSANSPTVDHGSVIPGFHCPKPGSALDQPRMSNGDYCQEWYGSSPDLGSL